MVVKLMEKCLNFFDKSGKILISPENTLKEIKDNNTCLNGIYFFIFFSAFLGIMIGAMIAGLIQNPFLPILMALLAIIIGLLKLFIWAGITHLVAKFIFKGKGKFKNIFGLMGYTSVTFILGIFALMMTMLATRLISSFFLFILMGIWMLVIATVAVNVEHGIGIGKSFLSCYGVITLIIIAIFLIGGV